MNNTNGKITQLLLRLKDQRSKKLIPGAKAAWQGGTAKYLPECCA